MAASIEMYLVSHPCNILIKVWEYYAFLALLSVEGKRE